MTDKTKKKVKELLYQIEDIAQEVSEEFHSLSINDHEDFDLSDDDMEQVDDYRYRVEQVLSDMQDMTGEFL